MRGITFGWNSDTVNPFKTTYNTPDDLLQWMTNNIEYDKDDRIWALKSPSETVESKKGNCHDQALLELVFLDKAGFTCGQLFFIEFNKDEETGGKTHTLTWYKASEDDHNTNNPSDAIYWFEHAWGNQAGIHGPYKTIDTLKKDVYNLWKLENVSNSGKFNSLLFADNGNYEIGMNLQEYVDSWDLGDEFNEASHGKLEVDYRIGWDYDTGHQIKVVYSLDDIDIVDVGDFYWKQNPRNRDKDGKLILDHDKYLAWVKKNIRKVGNNDHQSKGQKVLAIVDLVTNKELKSVKLVSPILLDNIVDNWRGSTFTHVKSLDPDQLRIVQLMCDRYPKYKSIVQVGQTETIPSFKATSWFANVTTPNSEDDLRFNKLSKAEYLKSGRGHKVENIMPDDLPTDVANDGNKFTYYKNPNRKQALDELYQRNVFLTNYINQLARTISRGDIPKGATKEELQEIHDKKLEEQQQLTKLYNKIQAGSDYNPRMLDQFRNSNYRKWIECVNLRKRINGAGDLQVPAFIEHTEFDGDIGAIELTMGPTINGVSDPVYEACVNLEGGPIILEYPEILDQLYHIVSENFHYDDEGFYQEYKNESRKLESLIEDYNENPSDFKGSEAEAQCSRVKDILMQHSITSDDNIKESYGEFDWVLNTLVEAAPEGDENDSTNDSSINNETDADDPPEMPAEEGSEEQEKEVNDEPVKEPEEQEEQEPIKGIEPKSLPKQADDTEVSKNGRRRRNLYIAFINYAKDVNSKNTFGSMFDKDAFDTVYNFVPHDMRYFYRLANPLLCVLGGDLTFFPLGDLRKVNSENHKLNEMMIFAATPNDMRVFSNKDHQIYLAVEQNNEIVLTKVLGQTFDTYLQNMIKRGDYLNGPDVDLTKDEEAMKHAPANDTRHVTESVEDQQLINFDSCHGKLFHLSRRNDDQMILKPKVPDNFLTRNGYEDTKTPRVCFSDDIGKCLTALSQDVTGETFNVYTPDDERYEVYKPSVEAVPDSEITGELWITKPVRVIKIGSIRVIGDDGGDGIPYKYGDNTAHLYKWNYEWISNK